MLLFLSIEDLRDIVVVVYGILGIVFFFAALIVIIGLFFTIKGLVGHLREILDDSVKPTLGSIKETVEGIRGTTEFVSQTAIVPIVRTYGMFAGARRGLGVLTGLTRRKRG
jgi:hypothetical protein